MRYRGISEASQMKWADDVYAQYAYAEGIVVRYFERLGDPEGVLGTEEQHNYTTSLAEWIVAHDTIEDRAKYPFCWDCGRGHDPAKISCEEVDEFISADEEMGRGM